MPEDWDFYLCRVQDAPASVFLNLALRDYTETLPETTLYTVAINMRHQGPHGLGEAEEVEALGPLEQAIVRDATGAGFRYVGRLRSRGIWQLALMAAGERKAELEAIVAKHLRPEFRHCDVDQRLDDRWSYYRDFLYPSHDRLQWIQNRRVIESLVRHGDPLSIERRVDHFVYFDDELSRAAFSKQVTHFGFELGETRPVSDAGKFGLSFHRVDTVELEHIHDVTMDLTKLARQHGGHYDGWETRVKH